MPATIAYRWPMRARSVLAIGAVAVVIVLASVAAAIYLWSGLIVSDDAVKAAKAGYGDDGGVGIPEVSRSVGWPKCAVVELSGVPGTGVVSVVVVRRGGDWRAAKVAKRDAWFDPDDASSSGGCERLAH